MLARVAVVEESRGVPCGDGEFGVSEGVCGSCPAGTEVSEDRTLCLDCADLGVLLLCCLVVALLSPRSCPAPRRSSLRFLDGLPLLGGGGSSGLPCVPLDRVKTRVYSDSI